jgi:WD40 repeat protein
MNRFRWQTTLFALVLGLAQLACNLTQPAPTGTPSPSNTVAPTGTPTLVPTATITPTPTITPTTPPTPTATLPPIASIGTPLPEYLEPISFGNANRVNALAEWKEDAVTDLAWTADGARLVVGGKAEVDFFDIHTRNKEKTLQVDEGLVAFALSPDERYLASGSNAGSEQTGYTGNVSFWRLSDDEHLFAFYLDRRGVSGVAFSPNGRTFAAAVTSPEYIDNNFIFWNTSTWEITRTFRTGGVVDMAFSPDGQYIASTPDRFAIRLWQMKDSLLKYQLPTSFTGAVNCLAFSPDAATLATGHYDGAIRLWDVAKGEIKMEFSTPGVVESLAFSPDGTLLASGESYRGSVIHIWDLSIGQSLRVLEGHTHAVDQLAFSPDGRLLASASYDGTLRLWGAWP